MCENARIEFREVRRGYSYPGTLVRFGVLTTTAHLSGFMKFSPAFQFYPADWLSDMRVRLLTFAERGLYIDLLAYNWREGFIPADAKAIAQLTGCGDAEAIEKVKKLFVPLPRDATKLVSKRLRAERRKQETFRKVQQENGVKGANERWGRHKLANGVANDSPMAENSSSSSSSFSSSPSGKTLHGGRVLGDARPRGLIEKPEEGGKVRSVEAVRPSWKEVQAKAGMIGLPEWRAKEWFEEMESVGWMDSKGREIVNAWSYMNRVLDWWKRDGCKQESPGPGGGVSANVQRISDQNELKRVDEAIRKIDSSYDSHIEMSEKDFEKRKRLLKRRSELKATLKFEA